eukprot:COSAG01_NODE_395_length_17610_cov_20.238764_4_plen_65_part_00
MAWSSSQKLSCCAAVSRAYLFANSSLVRLSCNVHAVDDGLVWLRAGDVRGLVNSIHPNTVCAAF